MTTQSWHRICALDDINDGSKLGISVQGHLILIIKMNDKVFAYEDKCPHAKAPLSDGRLQQGRLTCRHHQWQFDACTGESLRPRGHKIKSYPVKIEDNFIFVSLI